MYKINLQLDLFLQSIVKLIQFEGSFSSKLIINTCILTGCIYTNHNIPRFPWVKCSIFGRTVSKR